MSNLGEAPYESAKEGGGGGLSNSFECFHIIQQKSAHVTFTVTSKVQQSHQRLQSLTAHNTLNDTLSP